LARVNATRPLAGLGLPAGAVVAGLATPSIKAEASVAVY